MSKPLTVTVDAALPARQWRKLLDGQLRSAEAIYGAGVPLYLSVCDCEQPEASGLTEITIRASSPAPQEKPNGEA
jgi:hypothetical protein